MKVYLQADRMIKTLMIISLIVFPIAYIALCFNDTIWLDEALTGIFIRRDWGELIHTTAEDVHPPLYYLIAKLGILLFGDSIAVIKITSVIPYILCMLMGFTIVKREWGSKTALLFMLFVSLTPCAITKNIEMRMYSWALFFVLGFAMFAYKIMKEETGQYLRWAGLTLFGLAAAYTHYFALVSVAIFYGLLFLVFVIQKNKSKIIRIIICGMISGIGYFPWLRVFYGQTRNVAGGGWWLQTVPSIKDIPLYMMWPFRERSSFSGNLFLGIIIIGVGILIVKMIQGYQEVKVKTTTLFSLLCIGTYVITIIMGVGLSMILKPLYLDRYIYSALGILLLGLAIGISSLGKRIGIVIYTVIALFFLIAGGIEYKEVWQHQYNTESVDQVKNFMESTRDENAIYIFDNQNFGFTLQYFYPDMQIIPDKVADLQVKKGMQGKTVYYMVADTELSLEELNRDNENTTIEYIQDGQLSNVNFRIYKIKQGVSV